MTENTTISDPLVNPQEPGPLSPPSSHFRWVVCGLLFFATTINYADRQILGILASPLQQQFGWSESDYGWIVTAFQAAYAISMVGVGRVIDRIGTRLGYTLTVIVWSLAEMAHALAGSALTFGAARFCLGIGEAGNFPTAIKTVAEWFPKKERAFATGVFNSGSNVGAVLAPLLVPWLALKFGWRFAFVVTGAIGFCWVVLWWIVYREPQRHTRLSGNQPAHIRDSDLEEARHVSWKSLFRLRETWTLVVARFMTDPIWWFYLYWVPKYLMSRRGLTLGEIGLPLIVIYVAADAGSVGGGWLSSFLIRRGWKVIKARESAMLVSALMVTPMIFLVRVSSLWIAVAMIGLATAAHQAWAANIFTLVSDVYPQSGVASVIGVCGFFGSVSGMLFAASTGLILQWTGSYLPMFIVGGTAYLVGLAVIHFSGLRSLQPRSSQDTY